MADSNEKETRFMKVTMYREEFEKYDKGITHSDCGLRDKQGRLSTLPDISPVSDEDIPYREIVRRETVYVENNRSSNGIGATISNAIAEVVAEVLNDPEVQAGLAELGKAFWYYKVWPRISNAVQRLKSSKKFETKVSRIIDRSAAKSEIAYELEVKDDVHGKITVTGEDAKRIIGMVREEAKRLSAMIYLLSHITVKDDKTQDEYMIEQAYIKQLLSEDSKNTMEMLVANRKLLDKETAVCFSDFLSGYIRCADQRIAIPIRTVE